MNLLLENFLYENDISCDTCLFNTSNVHIENLCPNACSNELNIVYGAYNGSLQDISRDKKMCDLYEKFEEGDD